MPKDDLSSLLLCDNYDALCDRIKNIRQARVPSEKKATKSKGNKDKSPKQKARALGAAQKKLAALPPEERAKLIAELQKGLK